MPNPKKTIMRSLTIKELSGVDRPAQVGARMLIMKRADDVDYGPDDDDELTPERVADLMKRGKAALTDAVDGHTHLVLLEDFNEKDVVSGITSWQDDHTHPWILRDDGLIIIGTVDDHTHVVAEMSKVDRTGKFTGTGETEMTPEEKAAQEKLQKSNDELKAKNERLEKVGKLTAACKAHFETLDEDGQTTFLALSDDEQKAEVDKIEKAKTDADPVVYKTTAGVELRKSDGLALIEMAKQNDLQAKENADLKKKIEDQDLRKRAESELEFMPGTVETRMAMLKSIDGIEDEKERGLAQQSLKAQNESMSVAFKTNGSGHAPPADGSAEDELQKLATAHQKDNPKLTEEQAYAAVLDTKKGAELYNKSLN